MILNVATDFSEEFLEDLSKYKEVKVLFGKVPSDFIGGGVDASLLNDISYDYLISYIEKAKKKNIKFNYVINALVMNNQEFSRVGKIKLDELLDLLNGLDLESVTITNPYLVMYIKKSFKKLVLKASANFNVDSVEKARKVKEMGVDILVLDPLLVNKDFEALSKIRNEIGEDVELIVNNNCLINCPLLNYHQSFLSLLGKSEDIVSDFCYLKCSMSRLIDVVNYLKSDVIRPEDLHYYEELGYRRFKVIDRCTPPSIMLKRVKAYCERKYNGNLLDIVQHYCYRDTVLPEFYKENIYINNNALDGFLDIFVSKKCNGRNCMAECNHCYDFAKKAISVNLDFSSEALKNKRSTMEKVLTNEFGS